MISSPDSWSDFLLQTLLLRMRWKILTWHLPAIRRVGFLVVIIPSVCVGRRQLDPEIWVWDAVSSPPLPSELQLSFHLQQQWECRPGIWEHFWKLFSQLLITGNNYKFLVSTLWRPLAVLERHFLFRDPWRWWSHEEEMLKSHTLGTDTNHLHPSGFFTSLRCISANTSTFLTFNHWMEPSMKVLVKKWNETKYLESIFKETKEKEGHHQELMIGTTGTTFISLDSFS